MKTFLVYISILLCFYSSAQGETSSTAKIDSLKVNFLNSKNSDSLSVANAHYNIGELYRYSVNADSSYYHYNKAQKIYKSLNNDFKLALTLYGIAVIQKNEKDFTGSELTSIEAISLLDKLDQTETVLKYKSNIYNNLGLVFGQLEQYETSIDYYIKSIEIEASLPNQSKISKYISFNNLALTYKNSKQYDLAIEYFENILGDIELKEQSPDLYVVVLDNYAHTLYQSGSNKQTSDYFFEALKVSESIKKDNYSSIQINQHLAEYYNKISLKDSARFYAYEAKRISENYHNDDLLKSLLLLSKIEDGEKAAEHLKAYVKLSDSLQKAERKIRNKSARIRFETQQIEQENIRIARERLWLVVISIILLVAGVLIYIIITQRAKNKELKFAKQQQEANEEIYNLMLGEHEKVEEARAIEKQRISQELHDGVLGRLFGTRLSLDSLNMNNSADAIKTRGQYISELKTIEEDIRKVSHELNTDFVSGSGFIDILKSMIETQTTVYKLKYDLHHDDDINWDSVSNKSKIHIYRILQESLHNIHKHANATYIIISIKLENNVICLAVKDDGSGFDVTKSKPGIGLKNMNARIAEINGSINIESEIEKGTTVRIEVPTKHL